MSHTTVINTIVISDAHALRAAVKDMQKAGIKCSLKESATPRAWTANQKGLGPADFVLHLHTAKYDVGLYYNEQLKGYEARCDFSQGSIEKRLGVTPPEGAKRNSQEYSQAQLGRLYQAYGVCATERQARAQGYSVQRSTLKDGTVQLTLAA